MYHNDRRVHSIAVDKPEQKRELGRNGLAMGMKLKSYYEIVRENKR
jgi:hypothetical protein